jgi:hypothetical protein
MRKHIGKSLEEISGFDTAIRVKQMHSNRMAGQNNPNFGGIHSRGFADNPLCGKWEDIFGVDKAAKMKQNMSAKTKGKNNPMYGKPAPKKSGNGISGYYKASYFRSLLELSYMLHLDATGIKWESGETEIHKTHYVYNGIQRSYYPDFYLPDSNEYIEVKPFALSQTTLVQVKLFAVMAENKKISLITEHDIMKVSKEQLSLLIEQNIVSIDNSKQRWLHESN